MPKASFLRWERLSVIGAVSCWPSTVWLFWNTVRPEPWLLLATLLGSYLLGWGTALVFAPPPRQRWMVRFSLTTVALALALGALELGSATGLVDFRTVLAVAGPDPCNNTDNIRDPELIHIHKPYLKRVGATRGNIALEFHLPGARLYPYDVTCDHNGFRNVCDLSAAEVVVLGDSFVEGGLVAADHLMTATLGRLLGRTVANLGQSAYGPQQELAVLKRYAAPLHPKLCIWTFYEGNDLDDVARYEQFRQGGGELADGSTPWQRSFGRNALRALSDRLGRFSAPEHSSHVPQGTFRSDDGRRVQLYFSHRGTQQPRCALAALDKLLSVLSAAYATCATNRIALLVVFAPEKFRVYRNYCTFHPDNACTGWGLDDLPAEIGRRVTALGPGIGFLDLTPALTAEAARGRLLYFPDDTHWSAEGHEVAARTIAAHVSRQGYFDLPPERPAAPARSFSDNCRNR